MPEPKLTFHEESSPGEDLRHVARSLHNLFPTWDLRVFGAIDSTNAEARRIALTLGGDAWHRIVLADHQTEGRGRQGKTWMAEPETSLLVTMMAPVGVLRYHRTLMPLALGCWLMEGLESLGLDDVQVKWPNDVLVRGQKISGILCEMCGAALVMGIGVNLTQSREALPERDVREPQATSVAAETGEEFPGRLAASLTLLNALLASLEHPPEKDWILQRFRQSCATFGTAVSYKNTRGGVVTGIAEDIDETGALIVVDKDGVRQVIAQTLDPL
ncbi:MAG: BirA family transcriptional regulator [Candidatus Sumerlaeota bacterium]|nr:BirA family transcriptional regulator [Candidatus Sumerlaeota bacterium]